MKTLNYFSIAFAGLAMFCACNMAELENNAPVAEGDKVELVAGEGQIVCTTPPMTKTAVGAKGEDGSFPVVWVDKDQVKVYGESAAEGAVYTASVDQEAASAVFSADQVAVNDDLRYAVYPAALAGAMTAEGITVDLTSLRNQEYHSNIPNFGQMDKYQLPEDVKDMTQKEYYESATIFPHLPLWAKAENGSSEFKFNNLMGVVKLALNDYQGAGLVIKTVKLTAKTPVSGTMTVDAEGKVSMSGDEDAKSITIFSQPGVKLAAPDGANLKSAGTPFYFFVPAGTYEGFDFEFITTDGRIFRKSTNTTVAVAGGAVKKFPVLNFTLFYGKANCYLAPAYGTLVKVDITPRYSFDMTFNGAPVEYVEGAEPKFKAKVEWDIQRDGTNLSGQVIKDDASDITLNGNTLSVKTNYQGSALVSIRKEVEEEVNPILWSYHIWTVTADSGLEDDHYVKDVTYKVGADEFQMMSHNLGATFGMVSNAANAFMTYGMYYQWGRKDPLPAYGTSTYANGVLALFNSAVNQNNTIVEAMNNPLTMFINYDEKSGKRDMATTFPQTVANNVLWGATDALTTGVDNTTEHTGFVKTVYDPCPEGYMVPQIYHFSGLTVAVAARKGYGALLYYNSAQDAQIYYPLPGVFLATDDIVSGTTKTQGNGGSIRCHVSNPVGTTGWAAAYFRSQFSSSKVTLDKGYGCLANACSVRCLKISTQE